LPAGEVGKKCYGNLAKFCKLLLMLPHSTADPKQLISIIGKVDTSQLSGAVSSQALFVIFCLSSSCHITYLQLSETNDSE